jgi:HK97 family phage portal protein
MGLLQKIGQGLIKVEKAIGSGYKQTGTVTLPQDFDFNTGTRALQFMSIADYEDGPRRIVVQMPYIQNAWVYSAIRVMATNMAQAQWQLLTGEGENQKEIEGYSGDYGWVRRLFDYVSPTENRYSLFESILVWLSVKGECFWHMKRGTNNQVVQFNILPPDSMAEVVKNGELIGWKYRVGGIDVSIPVEDIIQFKYFNPYSPWRGLAPLIAATLGIHVDFAAGLYNYYFFNNDSTPVGAIKSDQELTPEEADAAEMRWAQKMRGPSKKGRVPVLGKGMEYKPIALAQKDIQYIEQKKWSREEVFAVLEVPPALSQVLEFASIKSNIKEQRKQLYENNLIPKMRFIEDVMKTQFFEREGIGEVTGKFDLSQIEALTDSMAEKAPIIDVLSRNGFTRNEINKALNLGFEDQPWGDYWWVPMTQIPAGSEPPDTTGNKTNTDDTKAIAAIAPPMIKRTQNHRKHAESAYRAVHAQEVKMRDALQAYFYKMRSDILGRVYNHKSVKAVGDNIVNDLLPDFDEYDDDLGKIVLPIYASVFEISLKNLNEAMGTDVSMATARADLVINSKLIKIREINDTIREQLVQDIRPIIREAVNQGDAYETVAGRLAEEVNNIFNNARRRTATVARTEVNGTLNEARWETMKEVGVEKHQWISTRQIRESHILNHLEIRTMGEPFPSGIRYPYDPDAPASEVVNCSCVSVPVME